MQQLGVAALICAAIGALGSVIHGRKDITAMANEPSSITKMKRFYGDRLYVPDDADMIAEMVDANDRSCIITVASLADAAVESVIAQNLPGLRVGADEEKEMNLAFRFDGPLGPFSARIDMAFYMGLIDAALRAQLHDLRALRNAVAHTKRRVTFADVPLQNVAKRLFAPTGKYPLLDDTPEGFKRTLIAEGNLIYNSVVYGRDTAVSMIREAFRSAGKHPPF